ncbi:hypothetical protein O6H91_16G029000 [Diphasiastrum complanatum]|uniref:Uncharacterized protein n=1 Tax=Diphasiastrum complanatum TaxID=34168 RepID=A0ACC2BB51_DIPCM|nr:hypothetical protein O6H91_16G029000 [Diphasiastrum complanatum]
MIILFTVLEFTFDIRICLGCFHTVADQLSRISTGTMDGGVNEMSDANLFALDFVLDTCYENMFNLFSKGAFPTHSKKIQSCQLLWKARNFILSDGQWYKRGQDGILRRCLLSKDTQRIIEAVHTGLAGGHFAADITTRKILQAGFWWPT